VREILKPVDFLTGNSRILLWQAKDPNQGVVLAKNLRKILTVLIGLLYKVKKLETMKRKKAKKSIDIHSIMKQVTPETQYYFDQLDMMDKQFQFYGSECDRLDKDYQDAEENYKYASDIDERLDTIARKFMELQARYERDKKVYDDLISKISKYFADKYGLTIDFGDA